MKNILVLYAMALPAIGFAQPVDNFRVRSLESVAYVMPADGGAQAELAAAYWRAGRTADAVAAYRRVLALDNVMLETRTGEAIWSHAVARTMLGRAVQTSSLRD